MLLVNSPRLIDDRTAYILAVRDGKVATDPATDPANPGRGIAACIRKLAAAGAEVVGVPCNTAHAPLIFDVVEREVAAQMPGIRLLHLVRATVAAVCAFLPQGGTIGLLATPGTYANCRAFPFPLIDSAIAFARPHLRSGTDAPAYPSARCDAAAVHTTSTTQCTCSQVFGLNRKEKREKGQGQRSQQNRSL